MKESNEKSAFEKIATLISVISGIVAIVIGGFQLREYLEKSKAEEIKVETVVSQDYGDFYADADTGLKPVENNYTVRPSINSESTTSTGVPEDSSSEEVTSMSPTEETSASVSKPPIEETSTSVSKPSLDKPSSDKKPATDAKAVLAWDTEKRIEDFCVTNDGTIFALLYANNKYTIETSTGKILSLYGADFPFSEMDSSSGTLAYDKANDKVYFYNHPYLLEITDDDALGMNMLAHLSGRQYQDRTYYDTFYSDGRLYTSRVILDIEKKTCKDIPKYASYLVNDRIIYSDGKSYVVYDASGLRVESITPYYFNGYEEKGMDLSNYNIAVSEEGVYIFNNKAIYYFDGISAECKELCKCDISQLGTSRRIAKYTDGFIISRDYRYFYRYELPELSE